MDQKTITMVKTSIEEGEEDDPKRQTFVENWDGQNEIGFLFSSTTFYKFHDGFIDFSKLKTIRVKVTGETNS